MKTFLTSIKISLVLLLICGVLYPVGMTGISQLLFRKQANGSLVEYNGTLVGSALLGQAFTDSRFFHGRISAYNYNTYKKEDKIPNNDGKTAYTGVGSGSANLAPSNPALVERVEKDINEFLLAHPDIKKEDIPTDLLTSSGSGLDPHISLSAANIQIPSIAKATKISIAEIKRIVDKYTEQRQLGVLGEVRFNFLKANLEIARILELK